MIGRDVIIFGGGRGCGKLLSLALVEHARAMERYVEQVVDYSPHAGERHVEVTRQVNSPRSRRGKAERWR